VEFRVLGPLEVLEDGREIDLGGAKPRALLAVLLLDANSVVSTDRLIDALWGERPPETAPKALQVHVSQLRRTLGKERIVTRDPGYRIVLADDELDLLRFRRLILAGRPDEALRLWRGPALADFVYEPFAQTEIARVEELRLTAVEDVMDAQLRNGHDADLVAELEQLVREHPLRERLSAQLMVALYRSGRQTEALEAYQRTRRRLADEAGLEPGPALRELERKILNHDETLGKPTPAAATARPRKRWGLAVLGAAVLGAAVLGVAVLAVVLVRDSTDVLTGIPANAVGTIDPQTNAVTGAVPVGIQPGPITAGAGSVWVANIKDRTLTRIDPRRTAVSGTIALGERTPTGIAAGAGAIWVAHGLRGELSRVEPQFGRVTSTIPLARGGYATGTGSVAVGRGFVWSAFGDSTLARVRPVSMRPAGSALTGSTPSAVLVVRDAVWVANAGDATVQRFNPATFEEGPVRTFSVGARPSALAFGNGALWVACAGDDVVARIDPDTRSTITIPVGDEPSAVAFGAGAVWVANYGDGTVARIDPARNEVVETIEVGNAPAGLSVADGTVWIAVQAP
jgi:YVTN family beta-propeller protein